MGVKRHQFDGLKLMVNFTRPLFAYDETVIPPYLENPVHTAPAGGKPLPFGRDKDSYQLASAGSDQCGNCICLSMNVMRPKPVLNVATLENAPIVRQGATTNRCGTVNPRA